MDNTKKIIRICAQFTLMFIIVALAFDVLFTNQFIFSKEYSNQSKLRRLIEEEHKNEIPVFGSSKARSAFIPDSLGPHVFNYGMEQCNFDVVELLLNIETEKDKEAPIIVEFNHRWFVHDPNHTINIATYVPNLDHKIIRDYLKQYDRMEMKYRLPGIRYFGSYFYYLRYHLKEQAGNKKIISRGGNFMDIVPRKEVFDNYVNARTKAIDLRHELIRKEGDVKEAISVYERSQLKYLHKYLLYTAEPERIELFEQIVRENPQRDFLIVYTPQHWSETKGIENFDEIEALFAGWETEFPNIKTFDYSHMDLPDDHFKNSSHLNLAGARAFSSQFAKDASIYLSQ